MVLQAGIGDMQVPDLEKRSGVSFFSNITLSNTIMLPVQGLLVRD
jgi:hypothetical protein